MRQGGGVGIAGGDAGGTGPAGGACGARRGSDAPILACRDARGKGCRCSLQGMAALA
jgi:hypothetical protein